MSIGENIKEFRLNKGISQRELARLIGKTGQFISLIEQGRNNPSIETLNKIATVLEVSQYELLVGEPFPETGELIPELSASMKEDFYNEDEINTAYEFILRGLVEEKAKEKGLILSPKELIAICDFLIPVIIPLLEHKLNEIVEKHKKEK